MADETVRIVISVNDQDAVNSLDALNRKIEGLGRRGQRAADQLTSSFGRNLFQGSSGVVVDFGRKIDENLAKPIANTTKRADELKSELARLGDDGSSSFGRIGAAIIVANQGLQLLTSVLRGATAAARALGDALEEAARFEGLQRGFENLQRSVGANATQSINDLRAATRGLVSDFELFEAANNAVLLGVDDGSGAFQRLAADAVKLGQAAGITAAQSIESLTVGIGRQSRLVLDNLGVIVKAEQAYEAFAAANNKLAEDLTDTERRIAFTEAAFEQITRKAAELPEVVETAGVAFQRFQASLTNARSELFTAISANDELADAFNELSTVVDGIDLTQLGQDIGTLAAVAVRLGSAFLDTAVPAINAFATAIRENEGNFIRFADALSRTFPTLRLFASTSAGAADSILGISAAFDRETNQIISRVQELNRVVSAGIFEGGDAGFPPVFEEFNAEIAEATKLLDQLVDRGVDITGLADSIQQLRLDSEINSDLQKLRDLAAGANDSVKKLGEDGVPKTKKEIRDAARAAEDFADAIEELIDKTTELAGVQEPLSARQEAFRREVTRLNDELRQGTRDLESYQNLIKTLGENSGLTTSEIEEVTRALEEQAKAIADIRNIGDFDLFTGGAGALGGIFGGLGIGDAFEDNIFSDRFKEEIDEAIVEAERLGRVFDQIAEEFGDSLGNALSAVISGDSLSGVLRGLGGNIGSLLGEEFGETIASGLGDAIGGQLGGALGGAAGTIGGPVFGALFGALGEFAGNQIETGIAKIGESTESTFEGIGRILDTALPFFTGGLGETIGSALGDLLGDGAKEAFRQAREDLVGGLNDILEEAGNIDQFSLIGRDGLIQVDSQDFDPILIQANELKDLVGDLSNLGPFDVGDFVTAQGPGQFDINAVSAGLLQGIGSGAIDPNLLPQFEGIASALVSAFGGVNEELAAVEQQFGQILAVNLENARGLNEFQLALERAGLSAEQLTAELENAFFLGDLSAQEFINSTASIEDLFAQGIPGAVGAVGTAFQNLSETGLSSGQQAQDALRDLAAESIEFAEANGTSVDTLQQLGDLLVNEFGASVQQTTALLDGLAASGISSINDLLNIDIAQTANVLDQLNQIGFEFTQIEDSANDALSSVEQFRDQANFTVESTWRINVDVAGDEIPEDFVANTTSEQRARLGPALE